MASSVPAAMTALMGIAQNQLGASVEYVDGEIGEWIAAEQFSMLTATWTDTPATLVGGSPEMFRESYDINCVVRTSSGGEHDVFPTLRARAMTMYGLIRNALSVDQSMGGVVLQAHCQTGTLATGHAGNVMASTVEFAVHVDNLTSS